jgi:hypothetical protein
MDCTLQVGTTTAEETAIEVTGLKPNTSYNFRVTARNDIGQSLPYAPEEPIIAGKRISEYNFSVLLDNQSEEVFAIYLTSSRRKCYAFMWNVMYQFQNCDYRIFNISATFSHALCEYYF